LAVGVALDARIDLTVRRRLAVGRWTVALPHHATELRAEGDDDGETKQSPVHGMTSEIRLKSSRIDVGRRIPIDERTALVVVERKLRGADLVEDRVQRETALGETTLRDRRRGCAPARDDGLPHAFDLRRARRRGAREAIDRRSAHARKIAREDDDVSTAGVSQQRDD